MAVIKKKDWKKACESLSEEDKQRLKSDGFDFLTGSCYWFLPVVFDSVALAKAYEEENYDEAMVPLTRALDKIDNSIAIFEKILKKLP
ncbi:MAG: hypothetical protein ACOY32_14765 [Thermodesulfobacteriota bacterium]